MIVAVCTARCHVIAGAGAEQADWGKEGSRRCRQHPSVLPACSSAPQRKAQAPPPATQATAAAVGGVAASWETLDQVTQGSPSCCCCKAGKPPEQVARRLLPGQQSAMGSRGIVRSAWERCGWWGGVGGGGFRHDGRPRQLGDCHQDDDNSQVGRRLKAHAPHKQRNRRTHRLAFPSPGVLPGKEDAASSHGLGAAEGGQERVRGGGGGDATYLPPPWQSRHCALCQNEVTPHA